MPTPLSIDEIRVRAYLLWEAEGCQQGRGDHYWHAATHQLEHERVSAPESASIDSATAPDAPKPKTAKRRGAAMVDKATPDNVRQGIGSVTNDEENAGKSSQVAAKRQKKTSTKADRKGDIKASAESDMKPDTRSNAAAQTKTEAKAKAKTKAKTETKEKVMAPAAAPKKATKSRRTKEDAGQAEASKAP